MLQPIAVSGMTVSITTPGVTGKITLSSSPSLRVKAGGAGVYRGPLLLSVSGLISASCGSQLTGSASATIMPTATKTRADGQFVLRRGDKVTGVQSTGASNPGSPNPIACTITFDIEITNAGQSKDQAE